MLTEPIKVMVVDENQDFLKLACQWISAQPSLQLVGTAKNPEEAVDKVASERPDLLLIDVPSLRPVLVLVDMMLPMMDGLQATARIKALPHAPKVVLMSAYEPELQGRSLGADAFINKMDFVERVKPLIETLFRSHASDD